MNCCVLFIILTVGKESRVKVFVSSRKITYIYMCYTYNTRYINKKEYCPMYLIEDCGMLNESCLRLKKMESAPTRQSVSRTCQCVTAGDD
jgi:hypothetical protein